MSPFLRDASGAVAGALAILVIAATGGFAALRDAGGDNDSLLRLVTVRDLLAGQGWFDPQQYRMGLPGGFPMHWSRIVDAPLALLVTLLGETVALVAWPLMLAALALFAIARLVRLSHGEEAVFPALVVGTLALVSTGVFEPGAIDHHNLQVTLTLAMAAGLASRSGRGGLLAGACAALLLAVAQEAVPYVAPGGLAAAWLLVTNRARDRDVATGFGIGFAAIAAVAFIATVPPPAWWNAACDAYSIAQGAIAVLAGLGLTLVARVTRGAGLRSTLLGLLMLGLAVGVVVIAAFPQCLSDPYAGLDPRLKLYWLDGVVEAQSVLSILRSDPAMLFAWYATPALALVLLGYRAVRGVVSLPEAVCGILLAAAFLVSLWQVRGAVFAIPLAVVPLAGWIGARRTAQARAPTTAHALAMAAAWALSFNAVWSVSAASLLGPGDADSREAAAGSAQPHAACYRAADYAELARLAPTTVLAVSNLGSSILAWTPHRALSGPYHRNVDGNLAALDAFLSPADRAQALLRRAGVGLVAVCPGNGETQVLARAAPGGLLAALVAGDVPGWLEPLDAGPAEPLRLYRVR